MVTREGLFPVDPIGAIEKIKDNYLRYFTTAYRFREKYEDLNTQKDDLLKSGDNLYKEPYLELQPEYKSTDKSLEKLLDLPENQELKGKIPTHYSDFIKLGLMSNPPYVHQFEMLRKAFGEQKNVVITSGTGSGKTESFLLPLFASLLSEANLWGQSKYNEDWYEKNPYDGAYQRVGESADRCPALRAMIMYPMNALVDDQMSRLREALDSEEIRKFFDKELKGNRIFFGRYNGSTIGSKSLDRLRAQNDGGEKAFAECTEELNKLVDRSRKLTLKYEKENWQNDDKLKKSIYISPRFPDHSLNQSEITGEMITRWDMQECPPDIFITNYSMLSVMLMRKHEEKMLERTRQWYAAEDLPVNQRDEAKKHRVFHLIIDELHLYRGTQGTEVSYLLRTFLDRIGVPPTVEDENGHMVPNKQLRVLASSASLEEDKAQEFLKQFFGIYDERDPQAKMFEIQAGEELPVYNHDLAIDYTQFSRFSELDDKVCKYINDPACRDQIKKKLIEAIDPSCKDVSAFLEKYAEQIFFDFKSAMTNKEGRVVPISIDILCNKIFGGNEAAFRGFLIFRADDEVNGLSEKYKMPRFRFHQFFKYIEGLWGELLPSAPGSNKIIGKLMYKPQQIVQDDNGHSHRVLELLRCECCGELFIGGNRISVGNGASSLSLNSPVLEQIPNRSATPMVERKRYPDYAIFWPHEDIYDCNQNGNRFNAIDINTGNKIRIENAVAKWERAYLNAYDGRIDTNAANKNGWIKGYLFTIETVQKVNNIKPEDYAALPCCCPQCDKSYVDRISSKSPIRSFRTGIKRSNQVLSKELLYQLPIEDRKLIGFSDSRQDAAEQAHGIAEEHYRDMVRMLFIQEIEALGNDNTIQSLLQNIASLAQYPPQLLDLIKKGVKSDINQANISPDLKQSLIAIVDNGNYAAAQNITIDNAIVPMVSMLHLPGDSIANGLLVRDLLNIYMNPIGVNYVDQQNGDVFWSEAYDFSQGVRNSATSGALSDRVKGKLMVSIFQNCFGQFMGLNTEESGLGYVNLANFNEQDQKYIDLARYCHKCGTDPKEFIAAYIRVLGDHYRYDDPDRRVENDSTWNNYNDYSAKCKAPIRALCALFPLLDENEFGQSLHNFLLRSLNNEIKLNSDFLGFVKVKPDQPYYRCSKCGRIHLHKGMGICTNTACCHKLEEVQGATVADIHRDHFISYDIIEERRKACRIHTEELTGQTDNQSERLLEFKDIILDDNVSQPETKKIDMISVTTTMEVGVDIGSLQAVYQGNMPPTRYNYQQRVGRAGRRKQAFSTVLTFCRGKSHDTYYYHEGLDEITGGKTASPQLSMTPFVDASGTVNYNDSIVKRVILKHVLHEAYHDCNFGDDALDVELTNDTHGEFGSTVKWNTVYYDQIKNWLRDINNQSKIKAIVDLYLRQFNADGVLNNTVSDIVTWVQVEAIDQMNTAIKNSSSLGVAQSFAEAGLHPMYGMPSDVRVMYHNGKLIKKENGQYIEEYKQIDRPLEQAITEFAPGAEKMKDHGVYRSAGLTVPYLATKYNSMGDFQSDKGRWDALEHTYWMHVSPLNEIDSITKEDHSNDTTNEWKRIVIPKAFRTEKLKENYGVRDTTKSNANFTQSEIWVSPAQNDQTPCVMNNTQMVLWDSSKQDHPVIWYVNDNNKALFKGVSLFDKKSDRQGHIKTIFPKYVNKSLHQNDCNELVKNAPNFLTEYSSLNRAQLGEEKEIALGARKITDMLRLSLVKVPDELCIDNTGYIPAIKSAFYSAATLIQRVFADLVDIQPDEIEISNVQFDQDGKPFIFLFDKLINGSGFVKMLFEKGATNQPMLFDVLNKIVNQEGKFMSSIFAREHKQNCATACQKCLCSYQNAGYHHILDWRLGIDLIKLMLDPNYKMGLGNLSATPYKDLKNQLSLALDNVISANPGAEQFIVDDRYYIKSGGNVTVGRFNTGQEKRYEQIVHPLWKHEFTQDQNIFELLRKTYSAKEGSTTEPVSNATAIDLD